MRRALLLFLGILFLFMIINLGRAAIQYSTLYADGSYVIQDVQAFNPGNMIGPFDKVTGTLQSTLPGNVFQGWESYAFTFDNITLENIDILSAEFSIRLNTTINWADDYLKLSYSTNDGGTWVSVGNLQPAFALTMYGNYTTSANTIQKVDGFQVKIQYITSGVPDSEIGDVITIDGLEFYLSYNTSDPSTNDTQINITGVPPNTTICINHTVTKGTWSIDKTGVTITYPNNTVANITTRNTVSNCGGGGEVYEVNVDVGKEYGSFFVNYSWVNDSTSVYVEESPHVDTEVLVRDDVLIVTLTGVPICFGLVYPNDDYVSANPGNRTHCSSSAEGFPMNISIESNIPVGVWFNSSDLTFTTGQVTRVLELGNLSFSNSTGGNKTSMGIDYTVYNDYVPAGNSNHTVYWWLYLNRLLEAGNYSTTLDVKINRTY